MIRCKGGIGKKVLLIILLLCAFLFAESSDSAAITQRGEDRSSLQFRLSGGYVYTYEEIGLIATAGIAVNNTLYSLSWVWVEEYNLFGPDPAEKTQEYSLLVGKKRNFKYGYFSASTGLSLINFLRRGELVSQREFLFWTVGMYAEKRSIGVGVPLRGELILKLAYVGVGIHAQININGIDPTAGIGLVVFLGSYVDQKYCVKRYRHK